MARKSSIKDPEMYRALRKDGASEEKAARISNAASNEGRANVSRKGGDASDYEERTVKQLRARAKELGVTDYSKLRKTELIAKIRNH